MKIINFEEAKTRKRTIKKIAKHFPNVDNGVLELQKKYQEYAQFCNRWYEEHVIGQDENGAWIYKDL